MKKLSILCSLILFSFNHFAHDSHAHNGELKQWKLKNNQVVEGSFSMLKDGMVCIEKEDHSLSKIPLVNLAQEDQKFANNLSARVQFLNKEIVREVKAAEDHSIGFIKISIILSMIGLALAFGFYRKYKQQKTFAMPMTLAMVTLVFYSATDPAVVSAAFSPFAPNVGLSYDSNYFYVESKGIPTTHTMMVGISNHGWQQQVPIPHCYTGTNHWSIPLNPVLAATPVPANNTHFLKGAIAIAVNGVPIFNVYTNTGVDSFIDGQLDTYGGHCGRGDDYHYHTAPLHLYGTQASTLPIAYALDGYAVFGATEPNGVAMTTLDANHGHTYNGTYHYHGTASAPYMIGNMVGVVTEDANLQIVPQPQGQPIRTENWGPLNGALITSCVANAGNGYNTAYSLNGTSGYATNFTQSGTVYTFNYVTPSGTTTNTYNGAAPCSLALGLFDNIFTDIELSVVPNPSNGNITVQLEDNLQAAVQSIAVYSLSGDLVHYTKGFKQNIDLSSLSKGVYMMKVGCDNKQVTKKIVIQ
jgi:Secretion system C-terminal sorting domain/YHYH protein